MSIFISNPSTICKGQKNFQVSIESPGGSTGCTFTLNILTIPVASVVLSLVSSGNIDNIVITGNSISFSPITPIGWAIVVNVDISGSGLVPGNTLQTILTANYVGCITSPPPIIPIPVESCGPFAPPPGTSGPSVSFFDCSCNKNIVVTIVHKTNAMFNKFAGRLFGNRPKW